MCLRFPPVVAGERTKFVWKFWLPSETIERRTIAEQTPFDRWAEPGGPLVSIPGGVFELDYAIKAALEACREYRVMKIGWDSWNALEFYNRMVAAGQPEDLFVEMRFGTKSLGQGTPRPRRTHRARSAPETCLRGCPRGGFASATPHRG